MKADELKKASQQGEQQEKKKKDWQPIKRTLLGEMTGKDRQKVYDKDSSYYGTTFYKLKTRNIENMENDAPAILYAFKETIIRAEDCKDEKELKRKEEVWRIIESDEYLGKRWIIYCYWHNKRGYKIYDLLERPK